MSLALQDGGHRFVELVHGVHQKAPGEKTKYIMWVLEVFGFFQYFINTTIIKNHIK